jgi:hypothetical protein
MRKGGPILPKGLMVSKIGNIMILLQPLGQHRETCRPILCGIFSSLLFGFIFWCFSCGSQTTKREVLSRGNPQSIVRPVFYPKTEGPYPAILVLPEAGALVSSHADLMIGATSSNGTSGECPRLAREHMPHRVRCNIFSHCLIRLQSR